MNFSKAAVKALLSMKSCTQPRDKISGLQLQLKGNETLAQHFVLRKKEGLNKSLSTTEINEECYYFLL